MNQAAQAKRTSKIYYGWVIVTVAFLVNFGEGASRNILLSLFVVPVTEEFGWSRTTFTVALSLGSLVGTLVAPIAGPFIDRRGPKGVMLMGILVSEGAILGMAFIGTLWHFYLLMILARVFSNSVVGMATSVAIANWFIRKRGRAMGLSAVGTRVSIPLFLLMGQALINASGWRLAWFTMGAISLLVGFVPTLLFMKKRPEDMGLRPDGDPPDPVSGDGPARRSVEARDVSWTLKEAIRTRALWLLVVATGFGGIATQAVNLHAMASLQDRGMSAATAATVVTFFTIVSGVGTLVWGFVAEKIHIRYAAALVFLFGAGGMVALIFADSLIMAYAYGLLYGICFGGLRIQGPLLYADYFGRHHLGTIQGFIQPFHVVTTVGGPILASLAFDLKGSYTIAFLTFLVCYVLAAAIVVTAVPPRKQPVDQPA